MATLVFSTTACLDKYPDDMVPADKAITTVDEVDQAIIGIYASWLNGALYSGYLTLLPDIQADLAYAVNGYSNQFGNTWRWNILATEPEYESVYAGLYNVITRCNFMLDNVDRVRQNTTNDDDLDRLDQYCGEAYFARALAYSELIKLFCKAYDPATAANELGVVLKSHYDGDEPTIRSSLEASYQFVLDDVDTVLVEITVIPETEQIQFQRLALHHDLPWNIGDIQRRKIRLPGDGAETGELRTIELDEIIPSRMLIRECLQHLRGIIAGILGVLIAQQCDIAGFFFTSSCHFIHLPVPDPGYRLLRKPPHGHGRCRRRRRACLRLRSSSRSVHTVRPVPDPFSQRLPLSR